MTTDGDGFAAVAGAARHIPVLGRRAVELLKVHDGGVYIDATFGAGGYTRGILAAAQARVIGIDRDPHAIAQGADQVHAANGRLTLIEDQFSNLDAVAHTCGHDAVDGVVLDLGVSSMQLDEADRGFSFRADGPLDMRMSGQGSSAADLVNTLGEGELADIIFKHGEERRARAIAKAILARRKQAPITRTSELADLVRAIVGRKRGDQSDPATRTFQALRIAVNDELGELDRGLAAAEALLAPGGRLAIVSFHSLEDRRIKAFIRERTGRTPQNSRHLPETRKARAPSFARCAGDEATAGEAEIAANPRARSARLRGAERTSAPAWGPVAEMAA